MTGEHTQDLSLGSFCYTKGLTLHEFIHALGKLIIKLHDSDAPEIRLRP